MPGYTKAKLRSRDKWQKLNELVVASEYVTLFTSLILQGYGRLAQGQERPREDT